MIFYIHLFCHDFRKMNGRIKIFEKCMPYRHSFRRVGAEREEGVPGGGRSTGGPASPGDPRALTVRSSIAVARLLISCSGFLRWNFVWNFLMGSESPPLFSWSVRPWQCWHPAALRVNLALVSVPHAVSGDVRVKEGAALLRKRRVRVRIVFFRELTLNS
jgi:hypothetical protein